MQTVRFLQVLKSLDWQKVTVDVAEIAVHSDAEHDGITLFMEAQVPRPAACADPVAVRSHSIFVGS